MTDFEKIYEVYFTDVYRFLKQLCKNDSLAEELTSEAFFNALKSLDSFRGDCDVRVWLCQIGKNCYYSYLKKHRRFADMEELDTELLTDGSASIEEQFLSKSQAMEIHELLHTLPEPYKEVFTLRVLGELSFQQIGKIFGKTENWACVTYHRARNKLREQIETKQNGGKS